MSIAYGHKAGVGITFQNSYGTPGEIDSVHWLPNLSESVGLNIPQLISENMRGIHDEGDSYTGPKSVDGDIEMEAQAIPLGAMFKSILNLESSVQSDSIYTHTFKPRAEDFDFFSANNPVTIFKTLDQNSSFEIYEGCTGTTLEMGISQGEFLTSKVSYVGAQHALVSSVATPSYDNGKRWKWDVTSVSLGGAGNSSFVNATISLDEALEAQHTLSSVNKPSRIKRTGFRSIAIDGTIKFDFRDEFADFLAQTEQDLTIHLEGATEIQSGYNESLTIKLPLFRFEEVKPMSDGPGQIEVSVTGRGKYSVTSATAMEITLVNTQAAY